MSGTSSVDFTTLYQAAKDVRSVKSEIDGEVRNFDGAVSQMLGGWRGSAATAFGGLAQQWQQDIGKILTALEGIAETLEKSAGMHQRNDEEQQSSVNSIISSINPS
jgi:WXG100 family type VII secretion target